MDLDNKLIEQVKKITSPKDVQSFIDDESFASLQKQWFQPSSTPHELLPPSNDETLQEIFSYIDLAISMYSEAIPHNSLNKVTLLFSEMWEDGIEPRIHIEFDSSTWTVVVDDLWQSELNLDRTMKQECVNLSEIVWYEYRPDVGSEQLHRDAEYICGRLRQKYPATEILFSVEDDL